MPSPLPVPGTPRTIDDVLEELDRLVAWSLEEESRLGYFATLYRKVTAKVKQGIEDGFFDDGARMERLDVVFAARYLEAFARFARGERPAAAWRLAFEAAGRWRYLVLQQLLAGTNAHINLDLGIAAAEIAPGSDLPALKADFDRINEILFSLVAEVEGAIGEVSPWIAWLERLGGKAGDALVRFSLRVARDGAWRLAERLAPLDPAEWGPAVGKRDAATVKIGRELLSPGPFLRWGLLLIRLRESSDVRRILEVLARAPEPALAKIEARRLARDRA